MTRRGWRAYLGKRVLFNLKSGNGIVGVVWTVRGDLLVVKAATLLAPDQSPLALDGEAIIDIGEVDFAQVANP